jgi:hypothetical protein
MNFATTTSTFPSLKKQRDTSPKIPYDKKSNKNSERIILPQKRKELLFGQLKQMKDNNTLFMKKISVLERVMDITISKMVVART